MQKVWDVAYEDGKRARVKGARDADAARRHAENFRVKHNREEKGKEIEHGRAEATRAYRDREALIREHLKQEA